jgi:hypothetical protein
MLRDYINGAREGQLGHDRIYWLAGFRQKRPVGAVAPLVRAARAAENPRARLPHQRHRDASSPAELLRSDTGCILLQLRYVQSPESQCILEVSEDPRWLGPIPAWHDRHDRRSKRWLARRCVANECADSLIRVQDQNICRENLQPRLRRPSSLTFEFRCGAHPQAHQQMFLARRA